MLRLSSPVLTMTMTSWHKQNERAAGLPFSYKGRSVDEKMKKLSIDIETYSEADLTKCGVYRYAEDESFEILLFGVSVDDGEVEVIDLAQGEVIPDDILHALVDESITKWAYNACFERVCLSCYLHRFCPDLLADDYINPESWRCSMVWSLYNGLPRSLAAAGKVLGLEEQKMKEGKDLIRYFCLPCKPTKTNNERTRNLPHHDLHRWETFKSYNKRDVEVEMAIQRRLANYPVPDTVWEEYHLDQKINDRGIMCDERLVENAIRIDEMTREKLIAELKEKTGLENPNSALQMLRWLQGKGVKADSLARKEVESLLDSVDDDLKPVLRLRQQLAKSSVKKYQAMRNAMCKDHRCRGMFQFYGASRSGRWAGRIVQLQNLYRNSMSDLEEARDLVLEGDYETLELLYDNVPQVLSELIRTAFIPKPGYKYVVSDFSAIEARVLSFLAGEEWRTKVFAEGGDIYCASASQMFHVPVVKHGINGHLRQKGKIAELALGYGGSVGALKAMGALEMGMKEEELKPLVDSWRASNPNIVKYWWSINDAVLDAVILHQRTAVGCVTIYWKAGMLFIELPSGRHLSYVKPRITTNQFGGESVSYLGVDAKKNFDLIESYGPKFVENIVQAISRDILCHSMKTLKDYRIVGHVHDELIIEVPEDIGVKTISNLMSKSPDWLEGISLRADGYECKFYMKD